MILELKKYAFDLTNLSFKIKNFDEVVNQEQNMKNCLTMIDDYFCKRVPMWAIMLFSSTLNDMRAKLNQQIIICFIFGAIQDHMLKMW